MPLKHLKCQLCLFKIQFKLSELGEKRHSGAASVSAAAPTTTKRAENPILKTTKKDF